MKQQRTLEINVISANDLKHVNLLSRMEVYAVVSISGDPLHPQQRTETPIDREGKRNPTWNFPITFTIYGPPARINSLNLVFKLRCHRALRDRDVGLVIVPMRELLRDSNCRGNNGQYSKQFVSYQVRRPSGRGKGELRFSYKFDDSAVISEEEKVGDKLAGQLPTMTYSPPPMGGCNSASYGGPFLCPTPPPQLGAGYYAYPPPSPYAGYAASPSPPPVYAYPPPQSAGYGYPPGQQEGYGYYSPAWQPSMENNFRGLAW